MSDTAQETTLAGRVALVTGASRGIGKAIALALAAAGMDVAVTARGEDALGAVADGVGRQGRRCLAVGADVGDPAGVQRLVERLLSEFGRVDAITLGEGDHWD